MAEQEYLKATPRRYHNRYDQSIYDLNVIMCIITPVIFDSYKSAADYFSL